MGFGVDPLRCRRQQGRTGTPQGRLGQGHVHHTALPCSSGSNEGGGDPCRGHQRARHVRELKRRRRHPAIGHASHPVHHARQPQVVQVMTRSIRVGAGLPEPGQAGDHKARLEPQQIVWSQAHRLDHAWLEAFDQHIVAREDLPDQLNPLWAPEVHRQMPLAGRRRGEVRPHSAYERGNMASEVTPPRRLDAIHARSLPRQPRGASRTREQSRQIQHAHVIKAAHPLSNGRRDTSPIVPLGCWDTMTHRQTATRPILVISDGTGDTARKLLGAAMQQFGPVERPIEVQTHVSTEAALVRAFVHASQEQALVITTLAAQDMRALAGQLAQRHQIDHIEILGPVITGLGRFLDRIPAGVPKLLHRADDRYFQRVEAIEFTVHADDGRDPERLLDADVVLIGPSRSGKTPLSSYLAHRGLKVANQPLVHGLPPPSRLFEVDPQRVFGLVLDADVLLRIRRARMASLRAPSDSPYATRGMVMAELDLTASLCRENGWRLVDVTNRAVEETAMEVLGEIEHPPNLPAHPHRYP